MKKIIQRCTVDVKFKKDGREETVGCINMKTFAALINEIRIKINIELQKQKLMDYKLKSTNANSQGVSKTMNSKSQFKSARSAYSDYETRGAHTHQRFVGLPQGLKRIQNKILLDFSLINPVGVINAIEKREKDDDDN